MALGSDETAGRRLARLAATRLQANRWVLAAGIALLAAAALVDPALWPLSALGCAGLIAASLMTPLSRRGAAREQPGPGATPEPLGQLSARQLAAAVTDPLVVFDGNGSVVEANRAALATFGPLDVGLPVLLKFRAPELQGAIEQVRLGLTGSAVVDYVERVPIERVHRVTASPIGHGSGLFVLVFKDQSEARRIDRMRADFIANASHELRKPLASIAGFVETLRGPARNDAAARDQFLSIMQNQTVRMARLIDDLLSLSRLEMKAHLPPDATVDIRTVIDAVAESLAPLAADTGVSVERALGDRPVLVRGERDELFQVFENLLENACKYGQSGKRVIVSIDTGEAADEASVSVRDFGPGIAAEHIPRITERFYRVDVATSRAQKGTGLGLAIVKHILTRHKARLTIRSRPGDGATFTVHLPLAQPG